MYQRRMPSGLVVWLTGLSGAGKTTLSRELKTRLEQYGHVELLDGDELRATVCKGLGFSREDRCEVTRRIGVLAAIVERCGGIAIVSSISPYASARAEARAMCRVFTEVLVDCPLHVLRARDTKGLYAKQERGELVRLTGVDDSYELPEHGGDVRVLTDVESVAECAGYVVRHLRDAGKLPAPLNAFGRLPSGPEPGPPLTDRPGF